MHKINIFSLKFIYTYFTMVESLKKYIISINLKSGVTNKLCYCRACYNKLGENHPELKTIVNKTDRILKHFKNCQNFQMYIVNKNRIKYFLLINKKVKFYVNEHVISF